MIAVVITDVDRTFPTVVLLNDVDDVEAAFGKYLRNARNFSDSEIDEGFAYSPAFKTWSAGRDIQGTYSVFVNVIV